MAEPFPIFTAWTASGWAKLKFWENSINSFMSRIKSYAISILIIVGSVFLLLGLVNSFFGWYGYEKWKYRRSTRGDILESKRRNVFIKNLPYRLTPDTLTVNFACFVEKGYKCGLHSAKSTVTNINSTYSYQVSFSQLDTLNNIYYELDKSTKTDSFDRYVIYLKNKILKDTIYVNVKNYNHKTIGKIKVFDETLMVP